MPGRAGQGAARQGFNLASREKFPSYRHQEKEFYGHCESKDRFLNWSMQLGKSKGVVDNACYLASEGKVRTVLVIAPIGVHANWAEIETPRHAWDDPVVFTWDSKAKPKRYEPDFDKTEKSDGLVWFCFSTHSLLIARARLLLLRVLARGPVMLVVDECHHFKTPGARRTRYMGTIAKKSTYRRLLSGTPAHQSPLDLFAQYNLFGRGTLGFRTKLDFDNHYARWQQRTTKGGRAYSAVVEFQNLSELRERMAPYRSVVRREDSPDVPKLVFQERRFEIGEELRRIYKEVDKFKVRLSDDGPPLLFSPDTPLHGKQHQITSGFLKHEDGTLELSANPRLDAFREELRRSYGRLIVWAVYRYDLDRVTEALDEAGWRVFGYHGRSTAAEKTAARRDFLTGSEDDPVALVGHPQSAGEGLTLASARAMIWYSMTWEIVRWAQANERLSARKDGSHIPITYLTAAGTIDDSIIAARERNLDLAAYLAGDRRDSFAESLELF